jgi:hypothetical protein
MIETMLTEAQELCRAIEQLPESAQQTAALLLAFGLAQRLSLLPPEESEGTSAARPLSRRLLASDWAKAKKEGTTTENFEAWTEPWRSTLPNAKDVLSGIVDCT